MTLVTGETDENDPVSFASLSPPLELDVVRHSRRSCPPVRTICPTQTRQADLTCALASLKCRPFNIQTLQSIFVNHYSLRPRHAPQAVEASVTWSNKTKTEASSNESFHKRKVPTISEPQLSLEVPGNSSHKLATILSPSHPQFSRGWRSASKWVDNVHHYSNLVLPPT